MVSVDANGADRGPGAVAEGVRRCGLPVLLFGPTAELSQAGPHAEIVDAPKLSVDAIVERAASDGPVDVLDESARTVRHAPIVARGCDTDTDRQVWRYEAIGRSGASVYCAT